MPGPVQPNQPPSRASRRAVLAGLGGAATVLALGAAGCTPDSTIHPDGVASTTAARGGSAGRSASPTPGPAQLAARDAELAMAGWLETVVSAATSAKVPAPALAFLRACAAAHTEHASVLARPDPLVPAAVTSATPHPSASPARGTWAQLASQLSTREAALASRHQAACLAATDAATALLFASLATFASAARTPGPAPVRGQVQPGHVDAGTRAEALTVLLSRLRALAEGLEIGAGQLPQPSPLYAPARERIAAVWTVRDATIDELHRLGQSVPPAELGYQMPGAFTSPAVVQRTWGALEAGLLDAWGRVAAASTGAQRSQAVAQMASQTGQLRSDGVALDWWPGWA